MQNSPALAVQPLQWSTLQHIDDVRKIDESDSACLEEIRRVLEKHDALDRFGVSLLHSHFQLADDELLLETTDVEKREHWVRPVKRADIARQGMEVQTTVVRFDEQGWNQFCSCARSIHGHEGRHMG